MISGIYRIINKVNNNFYIGSSENIEKRFIVHKHLLLNNKHHCIHLQNAVNKYGFENFQFEVLVTCPKEYCIKMEQWFLDNTRPQYNILKKADSRLGIKTSEETKKKQSEARLGKPNLALKGRKRPEVVKWLGKKNKGRKQSEEEKLKRSNSRKEYFKNNPPKKGYKISEQQRINSAKGRTGLRRGLSIKNFKLTYIPLNQVITLNGLETVSRYLKCHPVSVRTALKGVKYDKLFNYKIEII